MWCTFLIFGFFWVFAFIINRGEMCQERLWYCDEYLHTTVFHLHAVFVFLVLLVAQFILTVSAEKLENDIKLSRTDPNELTLIAKDIRPNTTKIEIEEAMQRLVKATGREPVIGSIVRDICFIKNYRDLALIVQQKMRLGRKLEKYGQRRQNLMSISQQRELSKDENKDLGMLNIGIEKLRRRAAYWDDAYENKKHGKTFLEVEAEGNARK